MDDIQFGDVQEAKPETSLRPDRNAHFAVMNYEQPSADEIPVFLDFDVMLDMERHAASDKSVELGGVLLGGQFYDEDGRPFVLITDSLRAKFYESTKGSFTFTPEAWTEITRERNEFADDLQMVGWYHTHPDWGVFLSGMDMFICNHFFGRPLDMAYVIDPCRGDRAFFQWKGDASKGCQRQKGFYVIASRYRAAELEATVASLQGEGFMPVENRLGGYSTASAPIINVSQPPQSPQQNLAVLGMLTIQLCLLALLVWKLAIPPEAPAKKDDTELAEITERLERIAEAEEAAHTHRAVVQALDTVLSEKEGLPAGTFERIAELQQRNDELLSAQHGHSLNAQQLAAQLKATTMDNKIREEELKRTLGEMTTERKEWKKKHDELEAELAKVKPKEKKDKAGKEEEEVSWTWYWAGGLALLVVALGGIAATLAYRPTDPDSLAAERAPSRPPATDGSAPHSHDDVDRGTDVR